MRQIIQNQISLTVRAPLGHIQSQQQSSPQMLSVGPTDDVTNQSGATHE
jgi:hypothetical protein